jgi:hypothetical protein
MLKQVVIPLAGVVAVGLTASTEAAVMVFTDEADFIDAAHSLSFESFENLNATNNRGLFEVEVSDFSVLQENNRMGVWDTPFAGLQATDGDNYIFAGQADSASPDSTTFSFDTPINSFGVTLTDPLDGGGILIARTEQGQELTIATGTLPDGSEVFWGIISEQLFTSISFSLENSAIGDAYGLDEIYYGITDTESVPEPASRLGLLAVGAVAAGVALKKKATA